MQLTNIKMANTLEVEEKVDNVVIAFFFLLFHKGHICHKWTVVLVEDF